MDLYEKYCIKFESTQGSFLTFFAIYKMVDSMNISQSLNINIGTEMKNPEMLKFVPDYLKTKKMCKHAVKKIALS